MWVARKRFVLLSVAAVFASLLGAVAPPASATTCLTYTILGSRGSGDNIDFNEGIGAPGKVFADKFRALVGQANVTVVKNPYPAVGLGENWQDWINALGAGTFSSGFGVGAYHDSVVAGTEWLTNEVASVIASCPSTRILLSGYSQGAHVTADTYQYHLTPDQRTHIEGVVLYGDPYFTGSSWAGRGDFEPNRNGILGPRDEYPFEDQGKILSYCHARDPVCQGRYSWGPLNVLSLDFDFDQHTNYDVSPYPEQAARYFAATTAPLPDPVGPPLDLAFALDSTGSMASSLSSVKTGIQSIVDAAKVASPDLRVALVDYKDTNQGDSYATRTDIGFTTDTTAFSNALNSVYATGGGDLPEAELSGIMATFGLQWRPGVRKEVVVLTDAPGKNPEPVTGYTITSVINAAFALDPAVIDAVVVGSNSSATTFQNSLTGQTGGQTITTNDPSTAANAIAQAIKATGKSPFASITPIDAAPVGIAVKLSAGASFDPLGRPLTYRWDLDGNGTYETSSPGPVLQTTFTTAGDRTVAVKVTNDTGQSGYGSLVVHVVSPGAYTGTPQAPTNVVATSSANSATLTWGPPSSGPPAEGYVVRATDGTILGAVDHGGNGSMTLPGSLLPTDVRVTAVNRLGEGGVSAPVHMAVAVATNLAFTGFWVSQQDVGDFGYVGGYVEELHGFQGAKPVTFGFQLRNGAGALITNPSNVQSIAWADPQGATLSAPTYNTTTQRIEVTSSTPRTWNENVLTVTLTDGSTHSITAVYNVV